VNGSASIAELALPEERSSPGAARRWVRTMLADHVADIDHVLLCVSELVTNALLHARTGCELSLRFGDAHVRIEVRDFAPDVLPIKRSFDLEAPTGRGLHLLEALSERWGVERDDASKGVWFEVPLRGHEEARG
jgi:anti-sigma regulatory factor (Ser/Thr protein kinase)